MASINTRARTIEAVQAELAAGAYSPQELLGAYRANIEAREGELNALVSKTYELAEAAVAEAGAKKSGVAAIPATIKDNFNWTDTTTTASSKILENYVSPYNATVVERLLDAGAAFLGKTNLDAFAHGSSTETSDFGVTHNPRNLERVAGGSSGGSAAAVAADYSVYAIGSETAGSVRGPAAWCGVYGFVPSYGVNSRYGVVAMGSSLDRPGVFANSVVDCALVTDVIAGNDPQDATSVTFKHSNYRQNLRAELKPGLRVGLPKQFLDERIDAEVRAAVEAQYRELEKRGAKLVEIDLLDPKYSMAVYTILCRSEVSSNLARIDGIRYGFVADEPAENIIEQVARNRGLGFGNEAKQRSLTGAYALSTGYYDAYYKKAQQVRTVIIDDFRRAFSEVDLIIGPTMPTVAPKIGVSANNPLFGELADILTEPSALAGLPCISIPIGDNSEGLPIGMQLFGPQLSEQLILNTAYFCEQELR